MKKQVYHKSKTKKIGLTLNQVNRAMIQRQATEQSMLMLLGLPLIVLRDKYGFGKKRLEQFTKEVLIQVKCVENGTVGLEEIHKVIKKETDRKSTRLNSSHTTISYAVFCLKKKNNTWLP